MNIYRNQQLISAHTCLDCDTVTQFALAVYVFCCHSYCVPPPTLQACQLTLAVIGDALVLKAVSTHCPHSIKLSSSALIPRHRGNIVTAVQIAFEVLRNARRWWERSVWKFIPVFTLILSKVGVCILVCVKRTGPYLSWRFSLRSGCCCRFVPRPWQAGRTFLHMADWWCHSQCQTSSRWRFRLSAPAWLYTLLHQGQVTRWCWLCYCHSPLN